MLPIKFYKADASTFVIKSRAGKTLQAGRGLSFFYNPAATNISAIPTNAQEAPFVFNLQSQDFQEVRVQGQITFRVIDAPKTAEVLNFCLNEAGSEYVSEDPLRLNDRVIRVAQSLVQQDVQQQSLRQILASGGTMLAQLQSQLPAHNSILSMGLEVEEISVISIKPNQETARALEAEARESILKEADDAVYLRRISAVEQERSIKEAELQTDLSVQQKEQQIEQQKRENSRILMREELATNQERVQKQNELNMTRIKGEITEAEEASRLIELQVAQRSNVDEQANASLMQRAQVISTLTPEALEALAMADMDANKLLASGMRTMALNADKIASLNLAPDVFAQLVDQRVNNTANQQANQANRGR